MPLRVTVLCASLISGTAFAADAEVSEFLGRWTVTSGSQAPWYDGSGAKPVKDPELIGKTLIFEAHATTGSRIVDCKAPVYTASMVEPAGLFEGGLKNPEAEADALGFKGDTIKTLNVACNSTIGDMELDFPMIDKNTLLLGLNNVIYVLRRAP